MPQSSLSRESLPPCAADPAPFYHRLTTSDRAQLLGIRLQELAQLTAADSVLLCTTSDRQAAIATVTACYHLGHFIAPFSITAQHPLATILEQAASPHVQSGEQFLSVLPHSTNSRQRYLKVALSDSHGQPLGCLLLLCAAQDQFTAEATTLSQLYALRAVAELKHGTTSTQIDDQVYFLQSILDAIPHPVFFKDSAGRYSGCNKTLETQLGISREQLLGKTVFDIAPQRADICHRQDLAVFHHKHLREYEEQVVYSDGTKRDVIFSKLPIFHQDGSLRGLVGTILDVSHLNQSKTTLKTLTKSMIGLDGQLCLNKVVSELCHWFRAEYAFIGERVDDRHLKILAAHSDQELFEQQIIDISGLPCERVLKHGYTCYEKQIQKHFPDGEMLRFLKAESYLGIPLYGEHGQVLGTLCVLSRHPLHLPDGAREVTELLAVKVVAELERKQAKAIIQTNQDILDYVANHQRLTGLPNAIQFRARLQHQIENSSTSSPAAILHLDLDRLKKINTSVGREVGDQLLQQVAQRLSQSTPANAWLAHLTSDEFGILLPRVDGLDKLSSFAEQLRQTLAAPIIVDDYRLHITTSIGIALYPSDGHQLNSLLDAAEAALAQAKELGGNTYQFYANQINDQARHALKLENHLHHALEQQQLELHYQPQYSLQSGQLVGFEALLRWHHPELGTISPADFIPLAEKTGLIVPIGRWVLETACRQNKQWQQQGCPCVPMAVNISPRQFSDPGLVQTVAQALRRSDLEPEGLELEITESLIMQDIEAAITTMEQLRQLGVSLSIDDFGTGYSSLSYLKRFPIQQLKIDRSFVRDVTTDRHDAAIVTSIIALADNMNLTTIAEGIENDDQLEFLYHAGCHTGQGYHLGRPQAAANLNQCWEKI